MKSGLRAILALAAIVMLMTCAREARAAIAVSGGAGVAALVSDDGETIIEPGEYSKIICVLENELYAAYVQAENGYALIDENGARLGARVYDSLEAAGDALIYSISSRYGVMTRAAEALTPCEYTWIVDNGEGGFLALRTDIWDDSPDGVYYIDATGRESPTGVKVMSYLYEFSDGLSPALSTDNGRYGYLNARGQWALRPQYVFADWFMGGHAMASLDSGSGVIDASGTWRITPRYDFINIGPEDSELIVGVNYGRSVTVFSAGTYEELYSFPIDTYAAYVANAGTLVCVYADDGISLLDASGEAVLRLSPEASVYTAQSGHIIVYDGQWGDECARVYSSGGAPLSPAYQNIDYFCKRGDTAYFIYSRFDARRAGQTVDWSSDSILSGVIDAHGNIVLPANYLSVSRASADTILAEGKYGIYLFDFEGNRRWSAGY